MTDAQTLTLADFLLARIAEDEGAAQAVLDRVGPTRAGEPYDDGSGIAEADDFPSYPSGNAESELDYFRRFDPRRMLAECEAKRRIVEQHLPYIHGKFCDDGYEEGEYPCTTLRALALPYANHPDYREEWKP